MAVIKKFRIKSFKEQETLLQLEKVSMYYDKRRILNDISFKVNRSEVLGLLGPNGVGKSTIFKIIFPAFIIDFGSVTTTLLYAIAIFVSISTSK